MKLLRRRVVVPSAHRSGEAARLVILASGAGSNMQAVVDACGAGSLNATVVAVATNRADAGVIARAGSAGIRCDVVVPASGEQRPSYDRRLSNVVAAHQPDLVVLAGWMRILSMEFLGRFPRRVINIHPALPGQFPGTHSIERALQASQRLGLNRTGVMVHYVPDEGVDDGPVIATREVAIRPDDSVESLTERVHRAEHEVLVEAIALVLNQPPARKPTRPA